MAYLQDNWQNKKFTKDYKIPLRIHKIHPRILKDNTDTSHNWYIVIIYDISVVSIMIHCVLINLPSSQFGPMYPWRHSQTFGAIHRPPFWQFPLQVAEKKWEKPHRFTWITQTGMLEQGKKLLQISFSNGPLYKRRLHHNVWSMFSQPHLHEAIYLVFTFSWGKWFYTFEDWQEQNRRILSSPASMACDGALE